MSNPSGIRRCVLFFISRRLRRLAHVISRREQRRYILEIIDEFIGEERDEKVSG